MPKILKILGKSGLCFIGLAAAGWGVEKLSNLLMRIHGQIIFERLYDDIIGRILWFLLAAAYAYTLFLVFRNEKRRLLIMALNGAVLFLFFDVLIYMVIYPEYGVLYIPVMISRIASPVTIALAFIFKSLLSGKTLYEVNKESNKAINIFMILGKFLLCFIALLMVLNCYDFLFAMLINRLGIYLELFDIVLFLPLIATIYAYTLYRLLKKYIHRLLIIIINAAFLLLDWGLILIPRLSINLGRDLSAIVCGNTALVIIALAFVFRSVEKRGNMGNGSIKILQSPALLPYDRKSNAGDQ